MQKKDLIKQNLQEYIDLLDQSVKALEYSYSKSKSISLNKILTLDELEILEAFTARFSRTSDILTQKVLTSFFMILGEDFHTLIDKANFLEKINVLKKADDILIIRSLRNEVSHEYSTADIKEMFSDTIKHTKNLLKIVKNLKEYINKKFL